MDTLLDRHYYLTLPVIAITIHIITIYEGLKQVIYHNHQKYVGTFNIPMLILKTQVQRGGNNLLSHVAIE